MLNLPQQTSPDYRRASLIVITVALIARLFIAALLGLGIDESYAVAVARLPSWSFFDHPPLGFMLARCSAWLLGSESPFAVRLPYVLLFAASSLLLHQLTLRLFGERAAFWAVAWLSIAPFFFFSAGGWVVPDGPLIFFLLLTALIFARLYFDAADPRDPPDLRLWLMLGLAFGLALLSKYQAVLAGLGALVFLATTPRGRFLLARPGLYAAVGIALLCFSPVIWWNLANGWQSFAFQSGRAVSSEGFSLAQGLFNTLRLLLGEALYLLPGPFLAALVALWLALRTGPADDKRWFCLWLALPAVAVFNGLAPLMKNSLPHWPMPGFVFALPLVGALIDRTWPPGSRFLRANFSIGVAAIGAVAVIGLVHIKTGLLTRFMDETPKWDRTEAITDWHDLRTALASRGLLDGRHVVAARNWIEAAKIDYALQGRIPVLVLSQDQRHFRFLHDRSALRGREALLVTLAPLGGAAAASRRLIDEASGEFEGFSQTAPAFLRRGGRDYMQFVIIAARFRTPAKASAGRGK